MPYPQSFAHPIAAKQRTPPGFIVQIPLNGAAYLTEGQLCVNRMGRGYAWLDTGKHSSLLDACNFVRTLEKRQGLQTGSPDKVAFGNGWIDAEALMKRAEKFGKGDYGRNLGQLVHTS